MNTRNAHRRTAVGGSLRYMRAPIGLAQRQVVVNREVEPATGRNAAASPATPSPAQACDTLPQRPCRHPLADLQANAELAQCEQTIRGRFAAIEPVLEKLARLQHEGDFVGQAKTLVRTALGHELPDSLLSNTWVNGLDMRALYANCVFGALESSVTQFSENLRAKAEETVDARSFFLDCGFHCVDITPCSDGRLKGLSKYILRLPLSTLTVRNAYAGALFDVEANIRHWESVELSRFRCGEPVGAEAGTHYLKVVVYHFSSSDPAHQGCAAHGSNERLAAEAGLERLREFREAIENSFWCGASVDILLIGVDTDTDAIRVHIPDSQGELNVFRFVDNVQIYRDSLSLDADRARMVVYEAVNRASESPGWGAGEGYPAEGMRRLIVNLLINNLSQIEYVGDLYGGRYPDIGHAERYISVGDGFHEVELRNVAYYVHLHTVEESSADLDIGIKIFTGLNISRGLPVPIAIHYRYDSKVPGSRQRMEAKCRRVKAAILRRYEELAKQNLLICQMSLQDRPLGSELEIIDEESV